MSAFLEIVKELTGDVSFRDAATKFTIAQLQEDAALFLNTEKRGGIWIVDKDGIEINIQTENILQTIVLPAAAVAFSGDSRTLYELLETSFFYNLVNPPSGGGGGLTTAGNGLSVRGGNEAILGGTLDQNTTVDLASFNLSFINGGIMTLSGGQVRTVLSQGSNYTVLNTDYAIEATAAITLTLPASPTIGQSHEIYANNNTVTINANAGQTIIGRTSTRIRRYSAIIVRYTSANNWLII